jgi:hypothetical protein
MTTNKYFADCGFNAVNINAIHLNNGDVYISMAQNTEDLLPFLENYSSILFINAPFKKAIKVMSYIDNIGNHLKEIINEINQVFISIVR